MKRIVSLYLDGEIVAHLKAKGVNISELVNDFLTDYIKPKPTPEDIKYNAEQLKVQAMELEAQAEKQTIDLKVEAAKKQELASDPQMKTIFENVQENPEALQANLRRVKNIKGIDLTEQEFRDLIKLSIVDEDTAKSNQETMKAQLQKIDEKIIDLTQQRNALALREDLTEERRAILEKEYTKQIVTLKEQMKLDGDVNEN